MIDAIRFRAHDGGLVVLQVRLIDHNNPWAYMDGRWVDARVEDLLEVSAFTSGQIEDKIEMLRQDLGALRYEVSDFHNVKNGSLPA
jgi:hypothetical protein